MKHQSKCRTTSTLAGVMMMFSLIVCAEERIAYSVPPGMVLIPAGHYTPLFRGEKDPKEIAIESFFLDVLPVTNGDFLKFVRANPKWQRSQVKRLFADEDYLKLWA